MIVPQRGIGWTVVCDYSKRDKIVNTEPALSVPGVVGVYIREDLELNIWKDYSRSTSDSWTRDWTLWWGFANCAETYEAIAEAKKVIELDIEELTPIPLMKPKFKSSSLAKRG